MRPRPSQIFFALICALSIGQIVLAAPGGRILVGAPPLARVTAADPSIRHGSAGSRSYWFFSSGGGYHGGK